MIFLVLILFILTLYFAQNKNRAKSLISNARRNWSYILGVIGVGQFLMGFAYEPTHFFIGIFVGIWAWFNYEARKGQKLTLKTTIKTIVLVLSSMIYLASINNPNSLYSVTLEAIFLIIVLVLRFDFSRMSDHKRVASPTIVATNSETDPISKGIIDESIKSSELKPQPKLSNKTKRLIYWIGGIILLILILPFIIFAIDNAVNREITYYHSVQGIGKVEEVDSCVTGADEPTYDIMNDYDMMCDNSDSIAERQYHYVNPYLMTYSSGNLKKDLENIIIAQNKECPLLLMDGVYIAVIKEEPHFVTMYTVIDESLIDLSQLRDLKTISIMKNSMTDYMIASNKADESYRITLALYTANGKGLKYHFYGNHSNQSFEIIFSKEELDKLIQI